MLKAQDENERVRLWVALGNQPGVSAWFTVWLLSRRASRKPRRAAAVHTCTATG